MARAVLLAMVVGAVFLTLRSSAADQVHARSLLVEVDAAYVEEVATLVARRGGSTVYAVNKESVVLSTSPGVTAAVFPSARPMLTALMGVFEQARAADDRTAQLERVEIRPAGIVLEMDASAPMRARFLEAVAQEPAFVARGVVVQPGETGPVLTLDPRAEPKEALLSGEPKNRSLETYAETVADAAVKAGVLGRFRSAMRRNDVPGSELRWYQRTVGFRPCTMTQLLELLHEIEAKGRVVVIGLTFRTADAEAQKPDQARMLTDVEVTVGAAHRPWDRTR